MSDLHVRNLVVEYPTAVKHRSVPSTAWIWMSLPDHWRSCWGLAAAEKPPAPGDYVGELGPLLRMPRPTTARALTDATVTGYTVQAFRRLLGTSAERSPGIDVAADHRRDFAATPVLTGRARGEEPR